MYQSSYQIRTTTGLTDPEGARAVARRIFDTYDKQHKGEINTVDVVPMIVDAYKTFNQYFSPNSQDTSAYLRVLDRNGDGRVTYEDIESLCLRYLCPQVQTTASANTTYVTQALQSQRFDTKKSYTTTTVTTTRRYAPEIEQKLDIARKLFAEFDTDRSGTLDENEISQLLKKTYQQIGLTNYRVTDDDVRALIEMATGSKDGGKVTLPQYENVVLRSLERSGIKLDSFTTY